MKTISKTSVIRGLFACIVIAAVLCAGAGCRSIDKGVVATGTSVDAAMRAWADYVVAAREDNAVDKQELAKKEASVRKAYAVYQAAMSYYIANRKTMSKGDVDKAVNDVRRTATELLETIK